MAGLLRKSRQDSCRAWGWAPREATPSDTLLLGTASTWFVDIHPVSMGASPEPEQG